MSKPTILLVEDDDFAALVAAEMLASDYDVRHVDNGRAALDSMAEGTQDLVLLDVEMLGMSGYEVCRALRDHGAISQLTASTRQALQGIEQRHRSQGVKSSRIFQDLQKNFERSILTLGITHSQEEELAEMLQNASSQVQALYDEGLEIGSHLDDLLRQLERASH